MRLRLRFKINIFPRFDANFIRAGRNAKENSVRNLFRFLFFYKIHIGRLKNRKGKRWNIIMEVFVRRKTKISSTFIVK